MFVAVHVASWVGYLWGRELPSPWGAFLSSRWFAFGLMVEVSSAIGVSLPATEELTSYWKSGKWTKSQHLKAVSCIGG